jgi:hypothetical protein
MHSFRSAVFALRAPRAHAILARQFRMQRHQRRHHRCAPKVNGQVGEITAALLARFAASLNESRIASVDANATANAINTSAATLLPNREFSSFAKGLAARRQRFGIFTPATRFGTRAFFFFAMADERRPCGPSSWAKSRLGSTRPSNGSGQPRSSR